MTLESWVVFVGPVLLGSFVMAVNNVLRRYILRTYSISPVTFLVWSYLAATILFCVLYLSTWGYSMPEVQEGFWRVVIVGAGANLLIQYFNAKAASIDKGEVSLTAPLQAMTPGIITAFAVLLGEYPGKIGILGIVCISIGSYIILYEKKPNYWYEYLTPLRRLLLLTKLRHLTQSERNKTVVVSLSLGAACMGSIGLLCDALYVRRAVTLQGVVLGSAVLVLLLTCGYALLFYLLPNGKKRSPVAEIALVKRQKNILTYCFMFGILWIAHVMLIWPTFENAYVAYVGTLKRFSILFAVVMGYVLFREEDIRKRMTAAFFIIAGGILISLDTLPQRLSSKLELFGF